MIRWKRTTAPDGIPGSPGPPPFTAPRPFGLIAAAMTATRSRARLTGWPTVAQLRTMAMLGGRAPASYRLDAAVNRLPESLPADFPHGADGLRFAHAGGELVALPNGCAFSL